MLLFYFGQYELLDEMMDFGFPQYTEAKILSEFIKTDAYMMEVMQKPPMAVTNAVLWRSEGIRYMNNEVGLFLSILTFYIPIHSPFRHLYEACLCLPRYSSMW